MAEEKRVKYIFGHSFPSRFAREARARHLSCREMLELTDKHDVLVEGHPGLTYDRMVASADHYLRKMKAVEKIDLLCIDMGTNDLCSLDSTPKGVVDNTLRFLDMLGARGITAQRIIFMSVIQRSVISRPNQVSVKTFNHRVRRFNSTLSRALKSRTPGVCLVPQTKVNYPKYLVDGCHLTVEGMNKYIRQIRWIIIRHCA